MSNWRKSAYASTVLLSLLILATLCPISFSSNELAEAATGTAQDSTLTFSFVNNRSTASVSLNVTDTNGTFATSTDGTGNTVDERAAFSLTTNNATGYTVNIKASSDTPTLNDSTNTSSIGVITTSGITADNFTANSWGLLPSKYNSVDNTTNYYKPTTTGFTIDTTDSANSTANEYTIGLGIKADYSIPAGTYNNTTLIVEYVANPVNYTITYDKNTEDTITNMPYSSNNYQQAGDTSATSITLSSLVPVRDGYDFLGWCNGTVTTNTTTNTDSCTGTVYNPDGDGTNLTFGIDKTTTNKTTIHAMWKISISDFDLTYDYQENTSYGATEYLDTGYYIDWSRDFKIEETFRISATGKRRLIIGNYNTTDAAKLTGLNIEINTSNQIRLWMSTGNVNETAGSIPKNKDISIVFTWTASTKTYSLIATASGMTTININGTYSGMPTTVAGTTLMTNHDHRGTSTFTALSVSSLKITDTRASGSTLSDLPTVMKADYIFNGWYTASNGGTKITTSDTMPAMNVSYYAQFAKNLFITFAGSGVSSVKVCKTSGNCSGSNLLGTVSVSGGSVSGLEYGSTYYLYPTFSTGYEFVSWAKTSSTGTLSSASVANPAFTMGDGDGAVTITGKATTVPLTINFGTGIYGVMVKSGSLTGDSLGLVTNSGGTVDLASTSTNYYLIPLYTSQYTFNSWTASGGTVTSDTTNSYGYYYYKAKAGVTNTATISAKSLGTTSSTTMQNLSASSCTHAPSAVKDSRDNEVYYIQRLADGKCWMLENLRLASGTLTSSNSNVSSSFTLPASGTTCFYSTANCDSSGDSTHTGYTVAAINTASKTTTKTGYGPGRNYVGVYYNYCAASAGTICVDSNPSGGNASYDICPAGWKMPAGGSGSGVGNAAGGYYYLYNTGYKANKDAFRYALSTPLSGNFYNGSASNQGSGGSFWSSTWSSSASMYRIYVGSSLVDPTSSPNRYYGFSVRCILK